MHHALPKHLKPVNNVLIPICISCHDMITSNDMGALTSFAYGLAKQAEDLTKKTSKLIEQVKVE